MKKLYAVFDPLTGSYTKIEDETQVPALIAQTALNFYLAHTNQSPYTLITVNDDDSETWTSVNGDVLYDSEIAKQEVNKIAGTLFKPAISNDNSTT